MTSGYLRLLAVLGICLLSPVGLSRGGGLRLYIFFKAKECFWVDAESIPIRDGAVLLIQPGQVHTFTNKGQTPAVFFVVTSPRFDEKDRIMVLGEHGAFR